MTQRMVTRKIRHVCVYVYVYMYVCVHMKGDHGTADGDQED
jgi:hypothetical protein